MSAVAMRRIIADRTISQSVHGTCDARFAGVREALADNIASRGEVGAAVVAYVEGQAVVDVWAGHADQRRTRPWREDTIVNVFSVGKAFAAICLLRLVDAGLVALDDPVSRHWPGFAADATVADVLSHRSGLAAIGRPLPEDAVYDWEVVTEALAAHAATAEFAGDIDVDAAADVVE